MTQSMRYALLSLFAVGMSGIAQAQPVVPNGGGGGGAGVSPYLNLLRNNTNNGNAAFNYLTITRPQIALQQQANQLNQNLQLTNQQLNQQGQGGFVVLGGDNTQPITGHRTTFGVLGSHFNSIGGMGANGRFGMNQGFGNNMRPGGQMGQIGAGMGAGATGARPAATGRR